MPSEGAGSRGAGESPLEREDERGSPEWDHHGGSAGGRGTGAGHPDLIIDVPSLEIEELGFEADNLHTRVSIQADLADMVKLNVGIDANLEGVKLEAKGIEARALVTAHLDNVRAILSHALSTLDNNPAILQDLARASEETSAGAPARTLEGTAGTIGDASPERGENGTAENTERETGNRPGAAVDATTGARRKAEELGADLSKVEGSGAGGRILIRDVISATTGR